MTARLGLGTYRCRDTPRAAREAVVAGVDWIDTAPNYHDGHDESALASVLADRPETRLSTKVGFLPPSARAEAIEERVLGPDTAASGHSLEPAFLRWQMERSVSRLGRIPDLVFLHNPEPQGTADLLDAFCALESACADGLTAAYGVATWDGFHDGYFTVPGLTSLARQAGGAGHRFRAVQMPLSLVRAAPIVAALDGEGEVVQAAEAGLTVFASAPLHGGALAGLLTPEAATLLGPNLSPEQAALSVVTSTPGVNRVLMSASSAQHWTDALIVQNRTPVPPDRLKEVLDVLGAG